jgi:hypothetical protein
MRDRVNPEDCERGPTLILDYVEGEPRPNIPPDAPRCPDCGQPHVLFIKKVIVQNDPPAGKSPDLAPTVL